MKLSDARLAELEAEASGSTVDGRLDFEQLEIWSLIAEVRASRAALARIASAYREPGIAPDWHAYVKRTVRQDWPTLTEAVEAAIR